MRDFQFRHHFDRSGAGYRLRRRDLLVKAAALLALGCPWSSANSAWPSSRRIKGAPEPGCKRYSCTIWNHDDTFGPADAPVEFAGYATVTAWNEREAAAKAYVREIGRPRSARLSKLRAPQFMMDAELNYLAMPYAFEKGTIAGKPCYVLDNMVESWFIVVEPRLRYVR